MKLTKPHLVGGIFAGVALAGLIGYAASAQGATGTTLVDKIAQRFNLNRAEVQKVFDDNRTQHMAAREQKYEDRLNQAIKDGKLTTAQKDLILAKHKELISQMRSQKDSLKGKTPAERQAARQKLQNDISAWEKQNNVPTGFLGFFGRGIRGHGLNMPGSN